MLNSIMFLLNSSIWRKVTDLPARRFLWMFRIRLTRHGTMIRHIRSWRAMTSNDGLTSCIMIACCIMNMALQWASCLSCVNLNRRIYRWLHSQHDGPIPNIYDDNMVCGLRAIMHADEIITYFTRISLYKGHKGEGPFGAKVNFGADKRKLWQLEHDDLRNQHHGQFPLSLKGWLGIIWMLWPSMTIYPRIKECRKSLQRLRNFAIDRGKVHVSVQVRSYSI